MASEDSRYRFSFSVKLEEEGKTEPPMMASELVYNGLAYGAVAAIEQMIGAMVQQLSAMGSQAAQQLGSGKKL
jgi:hypothetical protein